MILLTSLFLFSNGELSAQELNAKVTVNHNQIQGTDASVFENLQQTLEQFINTRQWTHYQFQRNERINCNFNITVSKYDPSSNLFTCSALIQANRPVYNAAYSSTLYNNQDGDFNFTFAQFDQIEFNEENIDNQLTALIAYYAYLIIGLDLDSFSPMGGEDILQRCMVLTNNAQNLNFTNITSALENGLKKAHENRPISMLPQIWTDYKKDELANIYKGKGTQKEKELVYDILFGINASQNITWDKIKQ